MFLEKSIWKLFIYLFFFLFSKTESRYAHTICIKLYQSHIFPLIYSNVTIYFKYTIAVIAVLLFLNFHSKLVTLSFYQKRQEQLRFPHTTRQRDSSSYSHTIYEMIFPLKCSTHTSRNECKKSMLAWHVGRNRCISHLASVTSFSTPAE